MRQTADRSSPTRDRNPRAEDVVPGRAAAAPAVSVVIPNWNGRELLAACVDSLRRQNFRDFEVLVVDNGSSDGSLDLLRDRFPEVVRIGLPENRGFSAAVNAGVRAARAPLIALLNNDTEVDPDWLRELAAALESRPEISFCASKIILHDQRSLADACGDYYTRAGFAGKRGFLKPAAEYSEPAGVFGACAAAAIYRRTLFDDVGLFDEDFFITHEDTDLNFRAALLGHRCLFVPSAVVYHRLSASLRSGSWKHLFFTYRNEEYVYLKNMPSPLLRRSLLLHCLTNLNRLRRCLFVDGIRGGLAFLLAKADVVRNLTRLLSKRRRVQKEMRLSAGSFEQQLERFPG